MARKTTIPVHSVTDRSAFGLEIERVNSESYRAEGEINSPHRDEHYIFCLQRSGITYAMIDFETVVFDGCAICCILPGQVHRFLSSENAEGWMIAAELSWISESYRAVFESQPVLRPIALDELEAGVLEDAILLFKKMFTHAGEFPLSAQVLHSLADTCIGMFAALHIEKENRTAVTESRLQAITRQFRVLLAREYKTTKSPAAYAALLNITPAYLNEAVKQVTGMPVSYWIQREVILEAKRMLYYTDSNAREIAYALGYDDPAYFARLFTKTAGMSPLRFRKDYRK